MIWRQAFDREVSVCRSALCGPDHRQFLVNPNLSLLLICRQATEELKLLDIQHRFIVGNLGCALNICRILKPSQLRRVQVLVTACWVKSLAYDEQRVPWTVQQWLDQSKSERLFEQRGRECEAVSIEDSWEKWHVMAMYDLVFTLKSLVDNRVGTEEL
jgi:hypothetical protein